MNAVSSILLCVVWMRVGLKVVDGVVSYNELLEHWSLSYVDIL